MMQFVSHYSGSSGNLYSLIDGDTRLLLECGVSIARIRQATGFNLSQYQACLLTHCHGDHAHAAAAVMKAGIDLYCSGGTADALGLSGHRLHVLTSRKPVTIAGITVMAFDVEHDAPEPFGYLIAGAGYKLLFATDTYYVRYKFKGLTHICIECNYSAKTIPDDIEPAKYKRLVSSHMSLETLIDMLAANDLSQVREVHLLHMSKDNSDADLFRDTIIQCTGRPVFIA